jgi:CheY-like chemotaxis protein
METAPYILLVDDEPDFLDNLSLALEMAGCHPVTAADGIEALQILQKRPIDLIVADINMPNMGGYQLYNAVRQHSEWKKIPFLFLTGCRFLSENEIRYGKTLGINDYLTKPISVNDLILAIKNKL